jgi:hypothetical protein
MKMGRKNKVSSIKMGSQWMDSMKKEITGNK